MVQPQGTGARIAASGEIIWPNETGPRSRLDATLPLTGSVPPRPSSWCSLQQCVALVKKPFCCFPQSSVERPTKGGEPILWLPPILGLSPIFWVLILSSILLCLAAHFLASKVCVTVFVVLLCLIGLSLHEFSHAVAAFAAGAEGVPESGYLTCDLMRYMGLGDIAIAVFFIVFGGLSIPGGRVYLDDSSAISGRWRTIISAAGPLANFLLAVVATCMVHLYLYLSSSSLHGTSLPLPIVGFICFIFLQYMAFIINLLPLPPFELQAKENVRMQDKASKGFPAA
ncbi:sterol-regulatory element binding protein site 2 protease [Cyclospora cayetanensis]|uniref:Sterol-regulatory element binding protein site 2 protease n=1 Tax=Cyclospora cayetanensis TaxID=88456 RepID=A0A1D3CSI0_9EIME|nr:sterol-regulatory element binding protein site 2 protease [Cyclospora cayetanensis]